MILEYWGSPQPYARLLRLLQISEFGTPANRVLVLSDLGYEVRYQQGNLETLADQIEQGIPCIVFLRTVELPYWSLATDHAVVLVGLDREFVYLNDPAFDKAPKRVSLGDFELAWLRRDTYYATIQIR